VLTRRRSPCFGHSSLRPGQADVIRDILSGAPVIAGDADGRRQIAVLSAAGDRARAERGGITLVVSPLIALMKDSGRCAARAAASPRWR